MLCAVGDLIEDVVVRLRDDIQSDSDTPATIVRRRGGSAANVAYFAAKLTGRSRFIGCVGTDPLGDSLIAQLAQHNVEVCGERIGRTGSIVVVAQTDGVRSMLTDRGDAISLTTVNEAWLNKVDVLHIPLYSFSHSPLADSSRQLIQHARQLGIAVSLDLSSVTLIHELGVAHVRELLADVQPDVLFCTRAEAEAVGICSAATEKRPHESEHSNQHSDCCGAQLVVVKNGSHPVRVFGEHLAPVEFAVNPVDQVVDATGAGDAFAAGFLTARAASKSLPECISQAQHIARRVVTLAGATLEDE